MAKHKYRVSSPEGAAWSGVEEGETVELELDAERETALVAAGWLEKTTDKKGGN